MRFFREKQHYHFELAKARITLTEQAILCVLRMSATKQMTAIKRKKIGSLG